MQRLVLLGLGVRAGIHSHCGSRRKRSRIGVDAHLLRERALVYGGRFCADFGRRAQRIEFCRSLITRANEALVPAIGFGLLLHERQALLQLGNALLWWSRRHIGGVSIGNVWGAIIAVGGSASYAVWPHFYGGFSRRKRFSLRRCGSWRSFWWDSWRLLGYWAACLSVLVAQVVHCPSSATHDAATNTAHHSSKAGVSQVLARRRVFECANLLNDVLRALGCAFFEYAFADFLGN